MGDVALELNKAEALDGLVEHFLQKPSDQWNVTIVVRPPLPPPLSPCPLNAKERE